MRQSRPTMKSAVVALLSAAPALVMAQSDQCISLEGSTACPAFKAASISRNANMTLEYPFLEFVSDVETFDAQLTSFLATAYVQSKYQNVFGCGGIDLTNSDDMYARFTKTVLCNTLVQRSIEPCDLAERASASLCADSCAQFAQSEAYLTSDDELCANPNQDLVELIRADFVTCSLPARALASRTCINGEENENDNCGFGNSTIGLCAYCSEDAGNDADICCYRANVEERCEGVELPAITTTMTFDASTITVLPTSTSDSSNNGEDGEDGGNDGLSGGAIAGIVIGALAGVALIAAGLFFCIRAMKRRGGSQQGSIFNQPSPARKEGGSMTQNTPAAPQGYEVLPGGRIARMSALEGHSGDSSSQHRGKSMSTGTAGTGVAAGYAAGRRKGSNTQSSSTSEFGESPISDVRAGVLRPPPSAMRRNGSLSSNSMFNSVPQSPTSPEGFSAGAVGSQQSEQLPFFKDYYSQDDIHPGDRVSVLWAYQPRASDEFGLDRGDMLKVVGIWDDGWATGILLGERADEWEARRQAQRDSGVSNASGHRDSSPAASGEIKAFPLVCVCLPEHWRKTVEDGEGSTGTGSNGQNPMATFS